MQTREKIIVGLAGVALLYFVIDALAVTSQAAKVVSSELSEECDQFIVRGKDTLSALKNSPELFRRISLLGGDEEARNPFIRNWLDGDGSGTAKLTTAAPRRGIRYTGYFESGGMCMVVINGQEYSVNQVVEGTGLLVKTVSKEHVVLQVQDPDEQDNTEPVTILKEVEDHVFKL